MTKFGMGLATLMVIGSSSAAEKPVAGYFRVWQGFRLPEASPAEFLSALPAFMNATVRIYSKNNALNQYLAAIPPAGQPAAVPDEFALVALDSQDHYRRIRSTPEGVEYTNAHWRIFDRARSKSLELVPYFQKPPVTLQSNTAYDLLGKAIDWSQGKTGFYLGRRKEGISADEFLRRMKDHIDLAVQSFRSLGLRGYIVIANEEYEAAYMNWEDETKMNAALQGLSGEDVRETAKEFLVTVQWNIAGAYNGNEVIPRRCYGTVK